MQPIWEQGSRRVYSQAGAGRSCWEDLTPPLLFPKLGLCEFMLLQQRSAGCAVALTTPRLARLLNHLLCVNSTSSWALHVCLYVFLCVRLSACV